MGFAGPDGRKRAHLRVAGCPSWDSSAGPSPPTRRAATVSASARPWDPRAIAFYRRNGFELDGAATTDPGAPGIVEVRMVRPWDGEDADSLARYAAGVAMDDLD